MKDYSFKNFGLRKISFVFLLGMLLVGLTVKSNAQVKSDAQVLYQLAVVSDLNGLENSNNDPIIKSTKEIKSEGSYLIKDGLLDDIYKLKFVLPSVQLKATPTNSLISDQKVTFEQTHIMVLPVMGMVHIVGSLTIGDVTNTDSFLLKFKVNDDQSISFSGEKPVRLGLYYPNLAVKNSDEVQLALNFVLKNGKTMLLF
jgi:hypothetical protein